MVVFMLYGSILTERLTASPDLWSSWRVVKNVEEAGTRNLHAILYLSPRDGFLGEDYKCCLATMFARREGVVCNWRAGWNKTANPYVIEVAL